MLNLWKEVGWGTIIYLAALTNVDESMYEANSLFGWCHQVSANDLCDAPAIKSVIVTMLILQVSKMMTIGLDTSIAGK